MLQTMVCACAYVFALTGNYFSCKTVCKGVFLLTYRYVQAEYTQLYSVLYAATVQPSPFVLSLPLSVTL